MAIRFRSWYDPTTGHFNSTRVVDGMDNNVNAYLNNMVYDSNGKLLMTWTRRDVQRQTDSNIMFAESPDNGVTWYPGWQFPSRRRGRAVYELAGQAVLAADRSVGSRRPRRPMRF